MKTGISLDGLERADKARDYFVSIYFTQQVRKSKVESEADLVGMSG